MFESFKRCKESRTSVDGDPQSRRPLTSRNDDSVRRVRHLICKNGLLAVREIPAEVGISYGTCQVILTKDLIIAFLQNSILVFPPSSRRTPLACRHESLSEGRNG
jgi:hypothetical protein